MKAWIAPFIFGLLLAVTAHTGVKGMPAHFLLPGEWPAFRGGVSLDARSSLKGRITRPEVAWKHFVGASETLLIAEPGKVSTKLTLPGPETAGHIEGSYDARWGLTSPVGEIEGKIQPIIRATTVTYARVIPGEKGLQKLEFESGFSKPTASGQWQPCVGRCFVWRDGKWEMVWETESIEMLFQPLPIAGDFDGDGQPEVAILPWYEILMLDARTGRVKDRCRFTEGRSYGFFGVYDLDGDGKSEFLVQSDFSKHVEVLGYRGGKLSLLWQKEIESDISNPQKILRVGPNPAADLDGDGRLEVTVNLYNGSGDGRWHITVHDGLTGSLKADLPDERLDSLADVDGDGITELLTTRTDPDTLRGFGAVRVRSLARGREGVLWEMPDVRWQTWEPPFPPNVNSTATFGQRDVLWRPVEGKAVVVLQVGLSPLEDNPRPRLLAASWGKDGFERDIFVDIRLGPASGSAASDLVEAIALDARKNVLMRATSSPDKSMTLVCQRGHLRTLGSRPESSPAGNPAVAMDRNSGRPVIVLQGSGEELVAFAPPIDGQPARELWRLPGRGQSTAWPQDILGPVLTDLDGDGRRQVIYAASSGSCARLQAAALDGRPLWHHDFTALPGGPPVWNTGGIILWQTSHFTHPKRRDVLVTVRRSMMHSEETLLLSGKDGKALWRRDRQISSRGVGGTPFAIADFDGDGLDDIASFHPSLFYILKGATGKDIIARDAVWEPVPAKPVYWGLPVAGDFEGAGKPSVFFATTRSSMTGLIRPDGSLAWWDALDKSPASWPAFGDFSGSGRVEAIGVGYEDGIRCYDTATGKPLWRMPSPIPGNPTGSASADIDSDGRDEALFTSGHTLYCFGTRNRKGKILWQLDLPAPVGPPAIADTEGRGEASILLSGGDGYVYCIR
ncbi:MAG: hypothetical protein IT210_05345 [Armatimonadetes bacterium]|nr:hypothetical protein [Armatimonadota bacterium]